MMYRPGRQTVGSVEGETEQRHAATILDLAFFRRTR